MTASTTGPSAIVAVDDDRSFREALGFVLRSQGYACRVAGDAAEARAILSRTEPAVAIVDLGLPDETGLSLARWILDTKPRTSVLILTGTADFDAVRTAYRSGVKAYLMKPLTPEELIEAVDRAIALRGTAG
jgi:DNA-binding NtrC family response regulator